MGAGYRNAAKQFVGCSQPSGLFVDSDLPPEIKHLWFDKLINKEHAEMTIIIPEEKKTIHILYGSGNGGVVLETT